MLDRSDAEQLDLATRQGRVLFSFNVSAPPDTSAHHAPETLKTLGLSSSSGSRQAAGSTASPAGHGTVGSPERASALARRRPALDRAPRERSSSAAGRP